MPLILLFAHVVYADDVDDDNAYDNHDLRLFYCLLRRYLGTGRKVPGGVGGRGGWAGAFENVMVTKRMTHPLYLAQT